MPSSQAVDADLESEIEAAIHAYIFREQPGANRSEDYNAKRVEYHLLAERDNTCERFVARIKAFAPPPMKLLELGSGAGGMAAALALAGYDVSGVDPNEAGVGAARLRAKRYPATRQRFETGIAEKLPFPDGTFDLVLSNQVLEHIPDLEGGLRECFRVLRPGGLMYHQVPNYAFFREPHYRVFWPPYLPRAAAGMYFRLIGRSPKLFYDEIFPRYRRSLIESFRRSGFVDAEDRYRKEVLEKLERGKLNSKALVARVVERLGRFMRVRFGGATC